MKPMKPSKKKTHPGMRLLSLLWLSALVAEAAAIEPGGFRDTFDSYTEIPKLLDFASQSFCGLGEHARPRAWRRAPRAALWRGQLHRRGADENGRGGRAPRDRQTSQKSKSFGTLV